MKIQPSIIPGLHALRGIAAVMIVIFHTHGILQLAVPPFLNFVPLYFGTGVLLFFVISTFSLFLSTQKHVGKPHWLTTYLIKRFFRIAPMFYLMIVVYLVALYIKFGKIFSGTEIAINFLFLFNLFPKLHESIVWAGWTIGVEFLFYFILPFFLIYVTTLSRTFIAYFICIFISMIAKSLYLILDLGVSYPYMSLLVQLGVFSAGMPAFYLWRHLQNHSPNSLMKQGPFLIFISICGIICSGLLISFDTNGFWTHMLWGTGFSMLIISQIQAPFTVITNRLTVHLGKISFSLYLLHPLLIVLLKPIYLSIYGSLWMPQSLHFISCCMVTLGVLIPAATLSYTMIESKGIQLGQRLIEHIKKNTEPHDVLYSLPRP